MKSFRGTFGLFAVIIFAVSTSACTKKTTLKKRSSSSNPVAVVADPAERLEAPHVAEQLVVKVSAVAGSTVAQKSGGETSVRSSKTVTSLQSKYGADVVDVISLGEVSGTESSSDYVVLQFPQYVDLKTVIGRIEEEEGVARAEPNYIMTTSSIAEGTPNDPFFSTSGSFGQLYDDLWGIKQIGAPQAWSMSTGQDVIVAVVDSGVDYNHPDLAANIWTNPREIPGNGTDDDGNGLIDDIHGWDFADYDADPMDDHGHGTHVAGTIAAVGNNGIGVVGVAPRAKIMAVRGLNAKGQGALARLAAAVKYAADNGAKVINGSFGGPGISDLLATAFSYAKSKGVTSIVAAGNSNDDSKNYSPASFPSVVTVSATTTHEKRTGFSSYGYVVDVSAPGGGTGCDVWGSRDNCSVGTKLNYYNILSTLSPQTTLGTAATVKRVGAGNYFLLAGTSMASPHVAGVAALILGVNPDLTPEDVKNVIKFSAEPFQVDPASDKFNIGTGRVNAERAVTYAKWLKDNSQHMPTALISEANLDGRYLTVKGTAGGSGFSKYSLYAALGDNPVSDLSAWTEIYSSSTAVNSVGGELVRNLDLSAILASGHYSLRLVVFGPGEQYFSEDRNVFDLKLLEVVSPRSLDNYRIGDTVVVTAKMAFTYSGLTLEWGSGAEPSSWSSEGITILNSSGNGNGDEVVVAKWDTSRVQRPAGANGLFYGLKLRVNGARGVSEVVLSNIHFDYNMQRGFPQRLAAENSSLFSGDAFVADLDGDGKKEIIVPNTTTLNPEDGKVLWHQVSHFSAYRADGSLFWEKEIDYSRISSSNVVGYFDGESTPTLFFVGTTYLPDFKGRATLYALNGLGNLRWKVELPYFYNEISFGEFQIDGQKKRRLLVTTGAARGSAVDDIGNIQKLLMIDKDGNTKNLLDRTYNSTIHTSYMFSQSPMVADVDADGQNEIVFVYYKSDFSTLCFGAIEADGQKVSRGSWPYCNASSSVAGALLTVAHPDGDLIVGAPRNYRVPIADRVISIIQNGVRKRTIPAPDNISNAPVVADVDQDGVLEAVIQCTSFNEAAGGHLPEIQILNFQTGELERKFSLLGQYTIFDGPTIADVSGDGIPDVLVPSKYVPIQNWNIPNTIQSKKQFFASNGVVAWTGTGASVALNREFNMPGLFAAPMRLERPIVTDLLGDGAAKMVALSRCSRPPCSDVVQVWDLGVRYRPETLFYNANFEANGRARPFGASADSSSSPDPVASGSPSALRISCPAQVIVGTSATCSAVSDVSLASGYWTVNGAKQEGSDNVYAYTWNNIAAIAGDYDVQGVAKDASGREIRSNVVKVKVSPPSLTISCPSTALVGSTATCTATVNPSGSLVSGEWQVNEKTQSNSSVLSYTWTNISAVPGSYKVQGIAKDIGGNTVRSNIVNVTLSSPSLSILCRPADLPTNSATDSLTVLIGGSATCSATTNGSFASGYWAVNGGKQEGSDNVYSYTWSNITAMPGLYQVQGIAKDASGTEVRSNIVRALVSSPSLSISCPSSVFAGNSATCSAFSNGVLASGHWTVNGNKQEGSDNLLSYTWDNVPTGSYTIQGVAKDAAGNEIRSSSVSVTVATQFNFTAATLSACRGLIKTKFPSSTATCSIGGSCGQTCGVPSATCASASPALWGACLTSAQ